MARIAEIEAMQTALATELEELTVARRVLMRLGGNVRPSAPVVQQPKMPRPGTTRDLFLEVLRANDPPWMVANEVRSRASELKGAEIPMGTVSPTLTDLKNAGLIVRDGMKVALASRVPKSNEAPAQAEAPNESEEVDALFR
jgi:hypothetical protein